jgi:hypothetical protein
MNMSLVNIILKCDIKQNDFKIQFILQRNKDCVSITQWPIAYCCVRKSSLLVWEPQEMFCIDKQ